MSTSVATGTLRSKGEKGGAMSAAKLAVALWFALLLPLQVYGQSQEGGLPATNERVTALEAAVAALQANLAAEIAARQALASDLANEISARRAADTALQNAINSVQSSLNSAITAETAARQAADLSLTNKINDEVTARQSGDSTLQTQLSALQNVPLYWDFKGRGNTPNGDETRVLTSQVLPAGSYLVHFTGTLHIDAAEDEAGSCALFAPGGGLVADGSAAVVDFLGTVSLTTVVSFGVDGSIGVSCSNSDHPSDVENMDLIAIPFKNIKLVTHPNT